MPGGSEKAAVTGRPAQAARRNAASELPINVDIRGIDEVANAHLGGNRLADFVDAAVGRHVRVAIDDAGRKMLATAVDHDRVRRRFQIFADRFDDARLHQQRRVFQHALLAAGPNRGVREENCLRLRQRFVDAQRAERIGLVNRVVPLDDLAGEVDQLADRLARVPSDVMAPTKAMLNRAMEAAGFHEAVETGLDLQSIINMSETSREFDAIVRRDGLRAALAWRDARYDERLAERGRAAADTGPSEPTAEG